MKVLDLRRLKAADRDEAVTIVNVHMSGAVQTAGGCVAGHAGGPSCTGKSAAAEFAGQLRPVVPPVAGRCTGC